MPQQAQAVALVIAGVLFIAFIAFKLRSPARSGIEPAAAREARRKLSESKRRFRDRQLGSSERAAAMREAAIAALDGLGRAGLAASYARRAERLDPSDPASVGLLATAMRRGGRYHALERLLWRRLSEGAEDAGFERAYEELLSLYEGPFKRPEVASVLRRLRAS